MAHPRDRLAHNAPGDLYVDSSCIDCDTCRWMAPSIFVRRAEQSSVVRQPVGVEEQRAALMALLSCPTASIGTLERRDLHAAEAALPAAVDEADGVFHCGYHHEASFGAASYLIVRAAGNVLVDSPRFTKPLVRRLEELGGVRTLFLTHKDDVADHARFAAHFGCERMLHAADLDTATEDVERRLTGVDPVSLDDELVAVPVPGHTEGSVCLLYRQRYLFSGDHLAFNADLGHVYAFRRACWYDWSRVIESTERLRAHAFEWILPGHGRRCSFPRAEMALQLERALAWMRRVA